MRASAALSAPLLGLMASLTPATEAATEAATDAAATDMADGCRVCMGSASVAALLSPVIFRDNDLDLDRFFLGGEDAEAGADRDPPTSSLLSILGLDAMRRRFRMAATTNKNAKKKRKPVTAFNTFSPLLLDSKSLKLSALISAV